MMRHMNITVVLVCRSEDSINRAFGVAADVILDWRQFISDHTLAMNDNRLNGLRTDGFVLSRQLQDNLDKFMYFEIMIYVRCPMTTCLTMQARGIIRYTLNSVCMCGRMKIFSLWTI